ncbi:Hsp20/alpha crystallin family protein [Methanocella sp. CWC-04]|uniref:Hsp20/alpha crystallin family protein n=1 Tax=Methanooceanicella nereidis TaxID=2052831 RepID=A0AAP2W5M5_9EURY|nr:Hsp20/alpha crystallin family protein [Methanocella sp. CWC-04]MCD1294478.1 Hsp20/alpha crystallin family protein [Methanocella sp. CWC-04]
MRYIWDPFDELRKMQYKMSRILGEMPELMEPSEMLPSTESAQVPYVDVLERENEIVVTADLPGVDKKDIKLNVQDNTLEISAEKRVEKEVKEEGYIKRERAYDRFYRTILLPTGVDFSNSKASFNNGVLEIVMPKLEETKKKTIPIS